MSKTNKFWTEKILKLLKEQSIPAVIWMLVMALYNFVDTVFIGRMVGNEGLAAVSIIFPAYMIIWAVASSLWVGAASIISRALWSKNKEKVDKTFFNYQFFSFIIFVFFSIFLRIFKQDLLYLFWAKEDFFVYAMDYFSVIIIWLIFLGFVMWNNNVVRSIWEAKVAMIIMLIWAVLNTILDPFLIKSMGMSWAAWATVISWIVSGIYITWFYLKKQKLIDIQKIKAKIDFQNLKEIIYVWMPSFFRQSAASLVLIVVNHLLWLYWGTNAISAYWMISRVMMLFNMPMFWVWQGMQPLIWYNHWAKLFDRERNILFLALKIIVASGVCVTLFYMVFPELWLKMFTTDPELLEIASFGMRIIIFTLALIWFQNIISSYYQAVWNGKVASILSILRPVIVFIPMLIILSYFFWLNGVWFSFPVSDIISTIITMIIIRKDTKKFLNYKKNEE